MGGAHQGQIRQISPRRVASHQHHGMLLTPKQDRFEARNGRKWQDRRRGMFHNQSVPDMYVYIYIPEGALGFSDGEAGGVGWGGVGWGMLPSCSCYVDATLMLCGKSEKNVSPLLRACCVLLTKHSVFTVYYIEWKHKNRLTVSTCNFLHIANSLQITVQK